MPASKKEILVDFYEAVKDASYYKALVQKLKAHNPNLKPLTRAEDLKLKAASRKKALLVLQKHHLFRPPNK